MVPLACDAAGGGLAVNLAGDFLEWAGRLLDGLPQVGAFRVRDLYLKRKELDEGIEPGVHLAERQGETPGSPAKRPSSITPGGSTPRINSEDRWETCFCFSLNAASGVEVEIPDPLGSVGAPAAAPGVG